MLYELTVPQLTKTLNNLGRLLDHGTQLAESKKFEVDVLLQARLAPDQFNLIRQVQIACDTAKLGISRITGKDAPVWEDTEKTLPDLKARIEKTVSYLNSFSAKDFNGIEANRVTTPRWEGKSMSTVEFLIQHMLPNFYFHVTTAYAILRHNGVAIGKKDFLGELPLRA
jgi:hypothetical protein